MHLRVKNLVPLFALVAMLGLSSTAFAQFSCNIASTPVSRATATGHTEPAGDITFICSGGGTATTTATATIDFGVTITNSTLHPSGATGIRIAGPTGEFAATPPTISSVSNATGQIVINLPATAAAATSQFSLRGVLVSLNGTGLSNLSATVSVSPGNNYFITAGQNVATVITTILPGLNSPATHSGTGGTATLFTNRAIPDSTLSVRIQEGYIDALRDNLQFNSGNTFPAAQGVDILLTFQGLPTGVTLGTTGTPCATTVPLPAGHATGGITTSNGVISATNNTAILSIGTADLTQQLTVQFTCTAIGTPSSGLLPAGTVTVQATLAPTGAALGSSNAVLTGATTGQIPRYQATQLPSTPLTVLNIVPATTNLLVPLAMRTGGFDTGISVANTTADPYGTAGGGAIAVDGPLTFHFFQNDGTTATYTTSATSPGSGLTSGQVAAGSTYVVNLSEVLPLATPAITGDFIGYVFIVTDFTHGHGVSFIVDWSGATNFTSAADMLVLGPPSLAPRVVGAPGFVESLGK